MSSDVLLMAHPLYVLWGMKLPRNQKRLLQAGFAAGICTCVANIALAVFILGPRAWGPAREVLIVMTIHMQVRLVCHPFMPQGPLLVSRFS